MSRPPNDRDLEFSRARWAYSQNNPVVVAHDPCRFESRIAMSMSSQSASVSAASLRNSRIFCSVSRMCISINLLYDAVRIPRDHGRRSSIAGSRDIRLLPKRLTGRQFARAQSGGDHAFQHGLSDRQPIPEGAGEGAAVIYSARGSKPSGSIGDAVGGGVLKSLGNLSPKTLAFQRDGRIRLLGRLWRRFPFRVLG